MASPSPPASPSGEGSQASSNPFPLESGPKVSAKKSVELNPLRFIFFLQHFKNIKARLGLKNGFTVRVSLAEEVSSHRPEGFVTFTTTSLLVVYVFLFTLSLLMSVVVMVFPLTN